ncbi:hypothetical protein GGR08_001003 [Bartonella fuyuanensis]|uniref:Uncharacterized protein n=1 Tax=Bartonella fuyuanensis TaxID=1460968 RepID=A0A840E164_9HYPH|nr:hypothetical protein [Bartonella fuyuanensis]
MKVFYFKKNKNEDQFLRNFNDTFTLFCKYGLIMRAYKRFWLIIGQIQFILLGFS